MYTKPKAAITPNIEAANEAFLDAYTRWHNTFEVVEGVSASGSLPHWNYTAREVAWQSYLVARSNWISAHAAK